VRYRVDYFGLLNSEHQLFDASTISVNRHYNFILADYSAVGQLRGYLENIVCREVEAIDGGAQIADLDQGILAGFKFNIGY